MDLFFYGSQDVPPSRRLPERTVPPGGGTDAAVCESCSAPIEKPDLTSGRAAEVYGVFLCERCRLRTRAEERVELYFCDRCHVSVPVYRVDTGEALAGDGRILCLNCRQRSNRRLSFVMLFSATLLALVAGGALALDQARSRAEAERARDRAAETLLDQVQGILNRMSPVETLRADAEAVSHIRSSLHDLKGRAREAGASLDDVSSSLMKARVEFLRQMEILEGENLSLLRAVDEVLTSGPDER